MKNIEFLKSTRFWKLVIIGVLEALVAVDVISGTTGQELSRIIEFVLGSSILIRTLDRATEKISEVK